MKLASAAFLTNSFPFLYSSLFFCQLSAYCLQNNPSDPVDHSAEKVLLTMTEVVHIATGTSLIASPILLDLSVA